MDICGHTSLLCPVIAFGILLQTGLTGRGYLGIYLLKNAKPEYSQTVIQAKRRTCVPDLQCHLGCTHTLHQLRDSTAGWFPPLSFISSVCPKLYSYGNNKRSWKPRVCTLCSEVSLCGCTGWLCLVPQGVYNSKKIRQANNFMYSKTKGESFKYQNRKQRLNNIFLTIQSHCPP